MLRLNTNSVQRDSAVTKDKKPRYGFWTNEQPVFAFFVLFGLYNFYVQYSRTSSKHILGLTSQRWEVPDVTYSHHT